MPIAVDIDVMLARRKMSVGELADRVGITPANLAVLKNGRAKAVRFATLAALCEVLECQPGDVLGVVEGDFVVIGDDVRAVAVGVVERMLAAGGELVTVVAGSESDRALADTVTDAVRRSHPGVDTVVYVGGQPRYPLLIGVE